MICGAQIVPFVIPMEVCYCMFEDVCMFIILEKKAFKKCQVLSNNTISQDQLERQTLWKN